MQGHHHLFLEHFLKLFQVALSSGNVLISTVAFSVNFSLVEIRIFGIRSLKATKQNKIQTNMWEYQNHCPLDTVQTGQSKVTVHFVLGQLSRIPTVISLSQSKMALSRLLFKLAF